MQLQDDLGELGVWESLYGFGRRKVASSEDFENYEYEEHTAYLIVRDYFALSYYHMSDRYIEVNQVVFCEKVNISETEVNRMLRGKFFDPKYDERDGAGGKLVRFDIIPKCDRNPWVKMDRLIDEVQIRLFTYDAKTIASRRIAAKMYNDDEPYKNAKFGIYRLGSTWAIRRLLWVGKQKENEDYCQLARLPKDIIMEIDSYLYPPVLSIRSVVERKYANSKYRAG
jgi:hypothetical protein